MVRIPAVVGWSLLPPTKRTWGQALVGVGPEHACRERAPVFFAYGVARYTTVGVQSAVEVAGGTAGSNPSPQRKGPTMAIRCGSCKELHETVAQVRGCYELGSIDTAEHGLEYMAGQVVFSLVGEADRVIGILEAARKANVRLATEPQRRYLCSLLGAKQIPEGMEGECSALLQMLRDDIGIEYDRIGRAITELKAAPWARKQPGAKAQSAVGRVDSDGMFYDPKTGTVYKVQYAVHGSGNLYAKVLEMDGYYGDGSDEYIPVTITDIRQAKNPEYAGISWRVEFKYVAGAISKIRPEWRMTKEDASQFGVLYGSCIKCGLPLTKEDSVKRGMGDICASKEGYWA